MPSKPGASSTLTDRYQTTIPEVVRRTLGLEKRDRIHYTILPDGTVRMARESDTEDDPVLGGFLDFLARDMKEHPERLRTVDQDLVERIESLVGDLEIDLDQPLPADDG